jgi:hypothetical protein
MLANMLVFQSHGRVLQVAKQITPVNCIVAAWEAWGDCSIDAEQRLRTRAVNAQADGGKACPELEEMSTCSVQCVVGAWSGWFGCEGASGRNLRKRKVVTQPSVSSDECPPLEEAQPCKVRCVLAAWQPWSECSVTCGDGRRARRRAVEVSAKNGGAECASTEEADGCNTGACSLQVRKCDHVLTRLDDDDWPCRRWHSELATRSSTRMASHVAWLPWIRRIARSRTSSSIRLVLNSGQPSRRSLELNERCARFARLQSRVRGAQLCCRPGRPSNQSRTETRRTLGRSLEPQFACTWRIA